MNVILSVKPEYCEEIKNGNKKYEFRKKIFKHQDNILFVFVYATSPVKKIIGFFRFETIIKDLPQKLWERCKNFAGIEKENFFEYFGTNKVGFAIEIKRVLLFEPIDPKSLFPSFSPPQSYCYIEESIWLMKLIKNVKIKKEIIAQVAAVYARYCILHSKDSCTFLFRKLILIGQKFFSSLLKFFQL